MRFRRFWRPFCLIVPTLVLAGTLLSVLATAVAMGSSTVSSSSNPAPNYGIWPKTATNWPCQQTQSYTCAQGGYDKAAAEASGWPWAQYGGSKASYNSDGDPHNCTLYAAYRLQEEGVLNPGNLGNASNWAYAAWKKGFLVNQTPEVGAIAQWNVGDGGLGHVGYVEAVDTNPQGAINAIKVSEDNFYEGSLAEIAGGYTAEVYITVNAPVWPANFIHFLSWDPTRLPLPANAAPAGASPYFDLASISCPQKGWCVAVGFYADDKDYTYGFLDTLTGGQWTSQEAPVPANAAEHADVQLYSVSCPAVRSCEAVGSYGRRGRVGTGLIETLSASGGDWVPDQSALNGLTSVSCGGVGSCVAIDSIPQRVNRIAVLSNAHWSLVVAPTVWRDKAEYQGTDLVLHAVTCPTASYCLAIGGYSTNWTNAVAVYSGGRWEPTTLTTLSQYATPASVACSSSSFCVAAYWDSGAERDDFVVVQGTSLGAAQQGPVPAEDNSQSGASDPPSVACAANQCLSALEYYAPNGDRLAAVQDLNGSSWSVGSAPLPLPGNADSTAGSNIAVSPEAVTCTNANYCVIVGAYAAPSLDETNEPFIDVWSGSQWTIAGVGEPTNGFPLNGLDAASCPEAGWCVAIGASGLLEVSAT